MVKSVDEDPADTGATVKHFCQILFFLMLCALWDLSSSTEQTLAFSTVVQSPDIITKIS